MYEKDCFCLFTASWLDFSCKMCIKLPDFFLNKTNWGYVFCLFETCDCLYASVLNLLLKGF